MGTLIAKGLIFIGAYQVSKNLIVPAIEGAISGVKEARKERKARKEKEQAIQEKAKSEP